MRMNNQYLQFVREQLIIATVDSIGQRNSYVKTWGCG
ncbi:antiterminator, partial [Escherichia coli]|nr:antiterminator [Escherichia coli]